MVTASRPTRSSWRSSATPPASCGWWTTCSDCTPSAAGAEVTMLTRTDDASSGTLLALREGEVVRRGRAARQRGTTVTVRHLFHPVPARLKFLSAGRAESLLAGQLVRRYA